MTEIENLQIVIEVIDSYSSEIDALIMKLAELEGTVQAVDDINLDVDVRGEGQIDSLMARLMALESMDLAGVGDIDMKGAMGAMGSGAVSAASDASDNFDLMNLRMSDLHNALARLVPLIFVIIGALPAMIGGIVALGAAAFSAAAALAALTALGAIGFALQVGEGDMAAGFQEIFDTIQQDFLDAFTPMARRLAPLFEEALSGFDQLFDAIAARGDTLVNLSDQARDFGRFMLDWLPSALNNMGLMVDAFDGLFSIIGDAMSDISILQMLTGFMAQAGDELITFAALVSQMIPVVFEMSIGFLRVVNALLFLVQAFGRLMAVLPIGNEALGQFIATALVATSAALIFGRALGVSAVSSIMAAVNSLGVYIGALISYIPTISSATAATLGFAVALGLATGGISLLIGGIATLGTQFGGLSGQIDQATSSLQSFQSQRDSMSQGSNPYANPKVYRDEAKGSSRFSGSGDVNVTVQGDADGETVRNQTHNAMYRLERTTR